MVLPMTGLALLLGVGGAIAIRRSVETVNDRILGAASRAIADSLTVEEGRIALNLSPAIFSMLEDAERDNVYYSVRQDGRAVTGYPDLPEVAHRQLRDTEVVFGDGTYRGEAVRIVGEGRRVPGIASPVVIEVAETMSARRSVEKRLLFGLATLEATLIGLGVLLLPIATKWGMRPLISLRAELDGRSPTDLTPLQQDDAPSELRELIAAFNGMLHRLDAALNRMRQFTADASHQLRTPLSILRTHIAVLRGAEHLDAARGSIDDIDGASDRLQRLVTQLLTLARADDAALAPDVLESVDANALVAEVAAEHAPAALARGISLQFEPSAEPIAIRAHPLLAGELIGNLVGNAIVYNVDNGWVAVSVVSRDGGGVDVLIEDGGPGIPVEYRAVMLTRFSRLPRDAPRSGSGLGLPIADALARAMGATLSLETGRAGAGLLARVVFPAPDGHS